MSDRQNRKLSRLFLLITAIGVVHMGEQIVFGVEELVTSFPFVLAGVLLVREAWVRLRECARGTTCQEAA